MIDLIANSPACHPNFHRQLRPVISSPLYLCLPNSRSSSELYIQIEVMLQTMCMVWNSLCYCYTNLQVCLLLALYVCLNGKITRFRWYMSRLCFNNLKACLSGLHRLSLDSVKWDAAQWKKIIVRREYIRYFPRNWYTLSNIVTKDKKSFCLANV